MTCEDALERISAALDGELSGRERWELDAHLDECPACAALFDELAEQSRCLRELDCETPEGLSARVLSRLPPWRTGPRFWRWAGVAAVCLGVALCLGAAVRTVTGWGLPASQDAVSAAPTQEAAPSPAAEPYSFKEQAKAAEPDTIQRLGVQYLSGIGTGALSGRYFSDAGELEDFLASCSRSHLAAALGYDEDYFAGAALLAVSCQGSAAGIQPVVKEVRESPGACQVILEHARDESDSALRDPWLILIEVEAQSAPPAVNVVIEG